MGKLPKLQFSFTVCIYKSKWTSPNPMVIELTIHEALVDINKQGGEQMYHLPIWRKWHEILSLSTNTSTIVICIQIKIILIYFLGLFSWYLPSWLAYLVWINLNYWIHTLKVANANDWIWQLVPLGIFLLSLFVISFWLKIN